jgi:hypothetical protein
MQNRPVSSEAITSPSKWHRRRRSGRRLASYPGRDNCRLSPGQKDFAAPQGLRVSPALGGRPAARPQQIRDGWTSREKSLPLPSLRYEAPVAGNLKQTRQCRCGRRQRYRWHGRPPRNRSSDIGQRDACTAGGRHAVSNSFRAFGFPSCVRPSRWRSCACWVRPFCWPPPRLAGASTRKCLRSAFARREDP